MELHGQADRRKAEQGYAMAALLVALALMAVAMTVAMPVWKQMVQREKEAELVFRGQQYVRAIGLFQRRTGPTLPPNVDVLVDQHFLRKKFKDPITGEDFLLIPGAMAQGQAQAIGAQQQLQSQLQGGRGAQPAQAGRGTQPAASAPVTTMGRGTTSGSTPSPYVAQGGPFGTTVPGGVTGVVSKSTDASIRQYNGRGHYNEWEFRYIAPPPPPQAGPEGGGPPGRGAAPGGRGGPQGVPTGPAGGRGRGTTLEPPGRGGPIDGRGTLEGPGRQGAPPAGAGGRATFPGGR